MKPLLFLLLTLTVTSCFKPVIFLQNHPNYPVDVFYENQRPDRPFTPLKELAVGDELPPTDRRTGDHRLLNRGNDMQQKELFIAQLTLQAKKLGADALIDVRYTYYTSTTTSGYLMKGIAVKYKEEVETAVRQ